MRVASPLIVLMLNGEKRTGLAPNLPLLAGKFAKGRSKAKEPVPGMPCRCSWIGAFNLGDSATIDADTGRVK